MNTRQWTIILFTTAFISAASVYWFAHRSVSESQSVNKQDSERQVLYWYDPMQPTQHFAKPGPSPFMNMQLLPKYADEAAAVQSSIKIDSRVMQNLGMRLATVEHGELSQAIDVVGTLMFNQRDIAIVQARANGFVTHVYQRAVGDVIQRDAALVDLLIPEWTGAQAEFIALLRHDEPALIQAARQRLMLLGMSQQLIAKVESTRQSQGTITITAPIAGAIESLEVRNGMTVSAGTTLATITGVDPVWLEAAVPESDSASIKVGNHITAALAAFNGRSFYGHIVAILPETNAESRTVRVRIELPNPHLTLKPGMSARVHLNAGAVHTALLIPAEALIRTGTRNMVLVIDEQQRVTPTEVKTGIEADGKIEIVEGLSAAQQIVASGQFLIDSEASLSGLQVKQLGAAP